MSRRTRAAWLVVLAVVTAVAAGPVAAAPGASAQERRPPSGGDRARDRERAQPRPPAARPAPRPAPHPVHPAPARSIRGRVFIGGYFYDPFYGPYPWWRFPDYPYWYYPVFDARADLRLKIGPPVARAAAVYVDGFYAGRVDDFDGIFQSLPLTPGGHSIAILLPGYRTVQHQLYLRPGSSFTLRDVLMPLGPGQPPEPPPVAPALPAPPAGSYTLPQGAPIAPPGATPRVVQATGFGTIDLFVQPDDADVLVDGQRWMTTDKGHFRLQVPTGTHRIEVRRSGRQPFAADVEVREGQETPLNVSLMGGAAPPGR